MSSKTLESMRIYPGTTPEREEFLIQKLREMSGYESSSRAIAMTAFMREAEVQAELIANPHLTRREAELKTFCARLGEELFAKVWGRYGELEAARVSSRRRIKE